MEINNEISEHYCSYEVSKLLSEAGCSCQNGYKAYSFEIGSQISITSSFYHESKYPYRDISHSLAIEWIRVNFMIKIDVVHSDSNGTFKFTIWKWNFDNIVGKWERIGNVNSYECPHEAREAALLYVLKNLIN